jgi:hypothetical protein
MGDAARGQLPLYHSGWHARHAGSGPQRHRKFALCFKFVNDLCVKLGANINDLVQFEKYAAAAQSPIRPASAARAQQRSAEELDSRILFQKFPGRLGFVRRKVVHDDMDVPARRRSLSHLTKECDEVGTGVTARRLP